MVKLWQASLVAAAGMSLALSGCAHGSRNTLPSGAEAYAVFPNTEAWPEEDVLRAGDHLSIRVLGEPELTSDAYVVDSSGNVQVPLAGQVPAAGQTSAQLRDELATRLGARFIRDPQVAVIVTERHRTTFTVEGDVREPGVFDAVPGTSLLTAIAQAKSPTDTARLDEVMIFRVVGSQRMGARFNIDDIRKGRAADPQVLAGDTVVVGRSGLKAAWKQFLLATPILNLFYIFR